MSIQCLAGLLFQVEFHFSAPDGKQHYYPGNIETMNDLALGRQNRGRVKEEKHCNSLEQWPQESITVTGNLEKYNMLKEDSSNNFFIGVVID